MLTWQELVYLPEADLARVDIAEVNIACARGLPGTENLDAGHCLRTLERWTHLVKRYTAASYTMQEAETPPEFANSRAFFRILCLISALQKHCGVHFNPECMKTWDFSNAADLFIPGLLRGSGGTCTSMPVLYVAIGRWLGYPLKLVHTKAHVFARWDDAEGRGPLGPERFNIEATGRGLDCKSDDYYKTWPFPITDEEVARNRFLLSLTPREELASFLAHRGHCLFDNLRLQEAAEAYSEAMQVAPHDPHYLYFLRLTVVMSGVKPPRELEHFSRIAVQERDRICTIREAKSSRKHEGRPLCTTPPLAVS